MRKYILIGMVLLTSCEGYTTAKYANTMPYGARVIETIEFEECEYVYLRRYGSIALIHKGNCKYCAKRNIDNDPK